MGNGIKPVAQYYSEVSGVEHHKVITPLDYSQKAFTYLKNAYTAKGMRQVSVNELEQLTNEYSNAKGGKFADRCLLKGLYIDGFSGANCIQNSPFLFFDIDVKDTDKKKENLHLFDPETNQLIFLELQKIAVFVWRSNSGNGIAGVLYVPQLAGYLNEQKGLHLKAGEAVTNDLSEYLHKVTGIERIEFDQAQSKFRQPRFLAKQKHPRAVNPNPFEFRYKVEKKQLEIAPDVPAYRPSNHAKPYGTIYDQFNTDNDVLTIAKNCGFEVIGDTGNKVRVKHPNTTSTTSGEIDKGLNVYFNYSESLHLNKASTPAQMVCSFQFDNDWSSFRKHLNGLGYKEKTKPKNEVKRLSSELKKQLQKTSDKTEAAKLIFSYCYDLQTLTPQQKETFINDTCPRPELKQLFAAYLNLPDYEIKPDKKLTIKNYVAEVLPDVLGYADSHKKVILWAETGQGKTTAFVRDFHKHRPNSRLLILVPLTIIINQNQNEYNNKAIFLTGQSSKAEFEAAFYEDLVFATYNQGAKLLCESVFDYVVIDEIHNLITTNDYKADVIKEIAQTLELNTVIGLTGTPTNVLKNIGYKILKAEKKTNTKTKIEVRYLNNRPYDIALSFLRIATGKTLLRLNDRKGIDILKDQLVSAKLYKEDEILVLYSTKEIKAGDHYKRLAHKRQFTEQIKVVITTELIDEGLSIDQENFTNVVFIEGNYHPRPEPIKQYFARFRNEDPKRKNYLYLRKKTNQTPGRFRPDWDFKSRLEGLNTELNEIGEDEVYSTYNTAFNNDKFYYDTKTVNPYFLAYSVTDVLFKTLNAEQFENYLETNYNLSLKVNKDFAGVLDVSDYERQTRKEIKRQVATVWINAKNEVIQVLALHTLNSSIRNKLTVKQIAVSPENESFVLNRIKEFENLYKRSGKLERLGVDDPDTILTRIDDSGLLTLSTEKNYKDKITLLKLEKAILDPKTATDIKAAGRFIKFAEWCKQKKEFTNSQAFKQLKKYGVYNNNAYTEAMLFTVLEWFGIDAKKDRNNNLIKCIEKTRSSFV